MSRIKLPLIILTIWFVLIFNLERLLGSEFIVLDPMVPWFVVFLSVVLLTLPVLARQNLMLMSALVFFGYAALFTLQNALTGIQFQTFLISVSILEVTLLLVRHVAKALYQFDLATETILLGTTGVRMLSLTEGEEAINHELYRARRFDRPVAIVYCEVSKENLPNHLRVDTGAIQWDISRSFHERYNKIRLIRAIASLTYKSDIIVEYGDGLVVCLPETNGQEARVFMSQLNTLVENTLSTQPIIGIACFPDEGLVFDSLVKMAQQNSVILTREDNSDGNNMLRQGDLMVEPEKRLQIEEDSAWLNRIAYQGIQERKLYTLLKRTVDILAVLIILPMVLPVMLVVSLLIFLDDGAPILYAQNRTGYGGKRFKMYKFRTMYVGAKSVPAQKIVGADGVVRYIWPEKVEKDDRITRVGHFLRKTSLDELPQLLNILRGDMTLIGPRPTSWDLDKYTRHQTTRLTVRPGITGLWQVAARDTTNSDERLLWDMKYIEKMSLGLDIRILWMTVAQVFKRGGV